MSSEVNKETSRGPIAWMAGNSVAANLLMLVLLVGGLLMGLHIKQEIFPDFTLDTVNVSVSYPGASPEEVETGVIQAIEEAVQGLEGVDEIRSTASEGSASVAIEAVEGADITRLWQEIKSEIDRITTFPDEAEEPQTSIVERKRGVLSIALYGPVDEYTLRETAELVRDELLLDPDITQAELTGVRDYEIHVEVSQADLRRYGITLGDVADTIARASVELGGGTLETSGGDILVRVKDRRDYAREYERLPLITLEDGSQILLGDIADVIEGFEDADSWASYNGHRSVMIEVYRIGDQTPVQVAEAGKAVVDKINKKLPPGLELTIRNDSSEVFMQRADLLLTNAYIGLAIVFISLAVFLEIRLAFWVSLGIPISFLGSFLFLSHAPFSINMITMFGFIVTLGIVVDDAVVVGENVYYYRRHGLPFIQAAVKGAREVAMPVVFSVLTNMVAFLPIYFVPGVMGKVFKAIPLVVICVFLVSLIESLFVLPAHLAHSGGRSQKGPLRRLEKWQENFSLSFESFVSKRYGGFLEWILRRRYEVLAFGIAILLTTGGYVASGRMGMEMFPKIESDYAYVSAALPYGSPKSYLERVEKKLVEAAEEMAAENGGDQLVEGIFSRVNDNEVTTRVYLTDADVRPIGTAQATALWREKVGFIPGLETITFESDRGGPGSGKALTVRLSHRDKEKLDEAGKVLAAKLAEFPIVSDIDDGSADGKRQYDFNLLPAGERMGLTSRDVANQVRHAFQGTTAVKQQRGRNEVAVRVRLPENERVTESTLENMVLQAPKGEILLRDAVSMKEGRAYTSIGRTNGRRVISVTADVRPRSQAEVIKRELQSEILPALAKEFPGLGFSFQGHQAEISDSLSSLISGLGMAMLGVFALLAIPFRSYLQPVIIMFCIPFGMIGAVMGHLIMGYSLSVMSLFGIVALSGVVVNGSLVLINFANRKRDMGIEPIRAVRDASLQRFRPILLTTLTTFGGLAPMILETSRQAKFMIPMAISLGFGVLFATFITLVMVPALYIVLEDIKSYFSRNEEDEGVEIELVQDISDSPSEHPAR